MIVIKVNYTTDAPIIKVNYDDAPIYISTTVDATYISVDYGSGAATNAVWGDITGTLSDQTDLQNALDDKVPYTGATGNVDLGEYELKAGQLTLDTSPTGTASVGTTRWNDTIGSSETTLKGGSVILKNGVDLVARVVNKVTPNTTLTKAAYQAVRISGAQGQRLAVAFAQANNDNNSADTIGLVTETIATNQEGFIMTVGNLEDINTTGSLQGETWADGDVLYLSPTVAGAITNIKPVAPQHLVVIGYVEYAHAVHGKIYVKVMNGWELGELHDVDTTGATNGQVLKYNGTIWTPSSDLDTGITSLNGLTALTQTFATGTSGTDFNISSATSTHTFNLPTASATNRGLVSSSDWSTFNAKIGGTLATGQVAFGSAANTIAGSNNLFWDNTNGRLGIGTNAPARTLSIFGDSQIQSANANNAILTTTTNTLGAILSVTGGTSNTRLLYVSPASGDTRFFVSGVNSRINLWNSSAVQTIEFASNDFSYINTGANFSIGSTTNSGQRLQVNGDAFIKGSGNTSATTALTVQNSDGTAMLRVVNRGEILIGSSGVVDIRPNNGTVGLPSLAGLGLTLNFGLSSGSGAGIIINNVNGNRAATSGLSNTLLVENGFAPTSGTGIFEFTRLAGTINQTGGANGITRGLYVNPTLTAAADWRSIEWSNNSGWGLYGAGTSNNFLNGRLGLGTTSLTNSILRIQNNPTGSTSHFTVFAIQSIQSDVTSTSTVFASEQSTQAAAFTLSNLRHFFASQGTIGATSAITNQFGFFAHSTLIGATSNYGFYGDIPSGTNRWNLYMNGTANNYMAGSLGIGTISLTARNLYVGKILTGGTTAYGISSEGQIQSDVTISGRYFNSNATLASATNVTNVYHYIATQGTFNGTTTNQIAFFAESTLTGGTNNFGFRSDIASASGRWNFYAGGTAANYLNGNTIIGGSATDGGQKLQVNGTTQMTPAADASALTVSGYSVTGSGATNGISLTGTWNTTGIPSAIFVNITNTASDIGSRLIDLRFNNASAFRVSSNPHGLGIPVAIASNGLGVGTTSGIYAVDGTQALTSSGGAMNFSDANTSSGYSYYFVSRQYSNKAYTSGTGGFISVERNFAPTSGTGVFNVMILQNTINQTGGANGITRGLYINPTLTSAADFRAIEVSAGTTVLAASVAARSSLRIPSGTAPTSPIDGDIWFDGTDLKMRIGGVTKTFTLV